MEIVLISLGIMVLIGFTVFTMNLIKATNTAINSEFDDLPNTDGNWTRFKTKGETKWKQ